MSRKFKCFIGFKYKLLKNRQFGIKLFYNFFGTGSFFDLRFRQFTVHGME